MTEASLDCILDGTKVRRFYVKNLLVCETDNDCLSLPTPAEAIITLREADPRCE